MRSRLTGLTAAALLSTLVAAPLAVSAQGAPPAPPPAPATPPPDSARGGVEEIVVTAERREQNLQDVAQSITAFSPGDLEAANIQDAYDLQLKVPGLVATGGLPAITLRGLGQDSDVLGPGIDPGFQLHINDIYVAQLAVALLGFVDLGGIEVLPGPQGTGFGRNSTGGSMNLQTKRPDLEDWEIAGDVDGSSWSNWRISATLNAPIVPGTLGARLAYRREIPSNYYNLTGQNGHRQRLTNNALSGGHYVRGSLRWTPGDDLTADLILAYSIDRDGGGSPRPLGPYPTFDAAGGQSTIFFGGVNPTGASPNPSRVDQISVNRGQFQKYKTFWGQAILEWNVANHVVKLNGNYQYWDYAIDRDQDFTDVDAQRLVLLDKHKTWSGEATIRSDYSDSRINWLFGANYQDDSAPKTQVPIWHYQAQAELENFAVFDVTTFTTTTPSTTPMCNGPCVFTPGDPDHPYIFFDGDTDTKTAGVFLDGGIDITEQLRFQAGVRYSWTERVMRDKGWLDILLEPLDVVDSATFGFLTLSAPICGLIGNPPGCGLLQLQSPQPLNAGNTAFLLRVNGTRKEKTWDSVTGRARVEWRPADGQLVYAGYSRGERHGGFNWFQDAPFDSETINAYEIGAKNSLLDGRLLLNSTFFFYDFENRFITEVQNNVTTTVNAPAASIYGIELQAIWAVTDQLTLSGNAGWLHTEITEDFMSQDNTTSASNPNSFCPGNPVGQRHGYGPDCLGAPEQNLKGNVLPRSPKFNISLSAEYRLETAYGVLTPRLDFAYRGAVYYRQYENPLDRQDAYTRTDFRLRYDISETPVWIEAYVQNIENNQHIKTQLETQLNWKRYYWLAAPRTIGVRFGFKFGGASAKDMSPF